MINWQTPKKTYATRVEAPIVPIDMKTLEDCKQGIINVMFLRRNYRKRNLLHYILLDIRYNMRNNSQGGARHK